MLRAGSLLYKNNNKAKGELTSLEGVPDNTFIYSNEDNIAIIQLSQGSIVEDLTIKDKFFNPPADFANPFGPTWGVLANEITAGRVHNNRLEGILIPIGINESANIQVTNNKMLNNGVNDSLADPALWVNESTNIRVAGNTSEHRSVVSPGTDPFPSPSGDGEISCDSSTSVTIENNAVLNSGAAGVYAYNCDTIDIKTNSIIAAGEYGIDIVAGSADAVAISNTVQSSGFAGAVYDEGANGPALFQGNTFINNRSRSCPGINVFGDIAGVTFINNTANNGAAYCTHH